MDDPQVTDLEIWVRAKEEASYLRLQNAINELREEIANLRTRIFGMED